jgi:predicted phage-related endonuclease
MGYINQSKSFREYKEHMEKVKMTKDKITNSVIEDLISRAERGYIKYNTTLGENNHQNMLQHAYEEALDMAQYLKKEITTLNTIQDLVNQYPNDADLGEQLRLKYGKS